eukprot:CAMPEP_0174259448 /NCGR_PEP_ID=MMETSP0439-20130205/8268_1 /TAXON_ID=0 /ORGANISM="Stereomyxa ramosa, Strain Chinc5" /LENGTH=337 /DNA_ID=CAMNT_0015343337 /DNA_START=57 /DNA_END=1070 /DNA_ORIENTATION=+
MEKSVDKVREEVPVMAAHPPRFDVSDEQGVQQMLDYLDHNGYAVIRSVATKERIEEAKEEFWSFVEGIKGSSVKRDNINSWDVGWKPNPNNGIFGSHGFPHSPFCWNTRTLPAVKTAFAAIWGTDDLIVSFDGGNAFRPWKHNPYWLTDGGWWHVDQNSCNYESKRVCVQGLVTYYDATPESGGLCVIPKSHLKHDEVCATSSSAKLGTDFVPLEMSSSLLQNNDGILVCAKAGDMLLWDSRTVHCNTPALTTEEYFKRPEEEREKGKEELIRLVSYVCMLPKSHASQEVLDARKLGFVNRIPSSHWPNKKIAFCRDCDDPFDLSLVSPAVLDLVGY